MNIQLVYNVSEKLDSYDLLTMYTIYPHPRLKNLIERESQPLNVKLYCSVACGNLNLVQFFVERGADDFNGAMEYAAYYGYLYIIKWLVEQGADDSNMGLIYANMGGHQEIVQYFKELCAI